MRSFKKSNCISYRRSGIGLELGRQLSQQGAHVWLMARRNGNLSSALDSVKAAEAPLSSALACLWLTCRMQNR
jgi:NADP-dependent 3-hydroxy acid dehydrogenase YdfG